MITLQDARRHLRIDGDQDDSEIEQKTVEAVALVFSYIGESVDSLPFALRGLDDRPTPTMTDEELAADYAAAYAAEQANWPARSLDAAILLVLGELWRNRESGSADPLSPSVKRILDLFKRPVYA